MVTSTTAVHRILLVDDNPDTVQLLETMLTEMGCHVATAGDGPEALDVAKTFAPDVVLVDIDLPVMDGYGVARALRSDGDSPILVSVTGYGEAADEHRAREAGFERHLVKPLSVDDLAELLE